MDYVLRLLKKESVILDVPLGIGIDKYVLRARIIGYLIVIMYVYLFRINVTHMILMETVSLAIKGID